MDFEEIERIKKENEKLKAIVECVDKLKQFNEDIENYALVDYKEVDKIVCENIQLKQKLADSEESVRAVIDANFRVVEQRDKLKQQLADTETQNKRVLEKLELIVRANQELEQKLAESEKNVEFYKERYSDATTSAYGADLMAKDYQWHLEKEIAELKQQLAEIEKESNARYKSWQEEIRECDGLRIVIAEVRKQLAEKEKEIESLKVDGVLYEELEAKDDTIIKPF